VADRDETPAVGPVYLAGPMTPAAGRTLQQNIDQAVTTLRYLTQRRIAAICPQLTAAVQTLDDVPYEDWMACDFVLLRACRAMLVLPGWDTSAGTKREIVAAGDAGVPVFYGVRPLADHLGVGTRCARPPKV
jgi:hypothetical protein